MNRYKCPVCNFGYSGPVKPLSCPVCNNEMLSYADYKQQASSQQDCMYTCTRCGAKLTEADVRQNSYTCHLCGGTSLTFPVVKAISDSTWLTDVSETKAWDMDEEDALVDREGFVHNLGVLLTQTREDVVKCELVDRGDTVVITFKGGGTRTVNVHADSYAAIIRDVMKQV